jgi:hypothetical protein
LFFFTYAAKIEKQIVIAQIKYITDDLLGVFKSNLSTDMSRTLRSSLDQLPEIEMAEIDKKVQENNDKLKIQAFKVLAGFLTVSLIVAYLLAQNYYLDFTSIVQKNLLILGAIGITEFIFATYIATHYITADPNYVRRLIINTVKEHVNKST